MIPVVVVTRTKDRPLFLARAIQSVADQSFKDYIHVIVNDGGDKARVEEVVSRNNRGGKVKLFHREHASGAPDTIFNESIDRINSEYIALHDDDDTWHADFLQTTVDHLVRNPHLGAVVVRTDKIIEKIEDAHIITKKTSQWMPDLKAVSLYRQCADNQLTPIATLLRRSAYEKVGKFDDTLPVVGDWEFGLRLLGQYDVDFVDPGFSLARYHHRHARDNSFAIHDHRYYFNQVANRYLREELRRGELGVGYIINTLRYEQAFLARLAEKFLPQLLVKKLKRRVGN